MKPTIVDPDREYQHAKDWVDMEMRKALERNSKTELGEPIIHIPQNKDIDGVIVKGVGQKRLREPKTILFKDIDSDHGAKAKVIIDYIVEFLV